MTTFFEKVTNKLHALYVFKIYVKFHANRIFFTIRSINLFFMYDFILQKLKF